jgi:hypothetical protein
MTYVWKKRWAWVIAVTTLLLCVFDFAWMAYLRREQEGEEIAWWRDASMSGEDIKKDEDSIPGWCVAYYKNNEKSLVFPRDSKSRKASYFVDPRLRYRLDTGEPINIR